MIPIAQSIMNDGVGVSSGTDVPGRLIPSSDVRLSTDGKNMNLHREPNVNTPCPKGFIICWPDSNNFDSPGR